MKLESFKYFHPIFKESENWGNIEKIKFWHIKHLLDIRVALGWPMIIHCSYEESGHSKDSYHYKGMATDFHFGTNVDFPTQYDMLKRTLIELELWPFLGVGVYPTWANPGFHIDGRGYPLQWIRLNNKYYYGEENVIRLLSDYEVLKSKVTIGRSV